MTPISLYIHWPFCLSKCPYCDFNSHVRESYQEAEWQQALCEELRRIHALIGPRQLVTIFFGGGTPSLMQPKTVEAIIKEATQLWQTSSNLEVTLEANPNSVEVEKFQQLASAGVNRISIGVQSVRAERLKNLGRKHSVEEAIRAIHTAQSIFKRVSFDLIYATPNQSLAEWEQELEEALQFGTEHLSLYQLTIEPNTAFERLHAQGELILPVDDLAADMYELTNAKCAANGLHAYEVSNYAKLGAECQHNLTYWRYGEYIGVGPGAHGRLIMDGKRFATKQYRTPERWLKESIRDEECLELSANEQEQERVLMGLRTTEGISWQKPISSKIQTLIDGEFLLNKDKRLIATPKGRLSLQAVLRFGFGE
ncbi:MAG: radical SAM family heme chaperone HemW [Pseudomonadota bacterium]|jgi:putative oxygen-independent coproporphyrinogen III oxidase|nr:radical SAM family heme chaperone HemW [Alphaproteobacteria bacterium]